MKKLLMLFSLCFAGLSFGQTSVTDAIDFTVKSTDGTSYNLFGLLQQNKYVMVEVWTSW
jgi:hypothetical protein